MGMNNTIFFLKELSFLAFFYVLVSLVYLMVIILLNSQWSITEFGAIDSACGNAGESLSLSVKVEAQYLPEQAAIMWYEKETNKEVTSWYAIN